MGEKHEDFFFLKMRKDGNGKATMTGKRDGSTDEVRGGGREREREEIPRRRNPLPGSLVSLLPRITLVIILFGGALSALQALRGCVSALSLSAGKNFGLKCRSLDHEWRVWRGYFLAPGLCIREKSERKGDRERVRAARSRLKKGNKRSGENLKTEPSDIDVGSVVDVILEHFK